MDQLTLARPHLGAWPTTQACALTGKDLLLCGRTLSPRSHTTQGCSVIVQVEEHWTSTVAYRSRCAAVTYFDSAVRVLNSLSFNKFHLSLF